MSIALFDDDSLVAFDHRAIGRGHAEQLIPAIAALPGGGRADSIWVGCGPGSFTGIRVGIAAARALAFAWGAELQGFDSLALIAAKARSVSGEPHVGVACEGGHGQWLVAEAPQAWHALDPDAAVAMIEADSVAGNCANALVAMRGWGRAIDSEPDTRAARLMPADAMFDGATALYARAPDAKPGLAPGAGAAARPSL